MTQDEMQKIIENMQLEFSKKIAEVENKLNALSADVKIINNFVSAITEAQDLTQTMGEIESVTKQLTNCDKATFYCYDNSNDKFFANGDYRSWQDEQNAEELKNAFENKEISSDGKEAVIPLVSANGNSLGVIVAEKAEGFTPGDYENFKPGCQIACTVELAMKKENEHQGRITDELTHLKNRQGLNEYLSNTMCSNLAKGDTVNIIMCDIDHFKSVNDTYGHDAGDIILKGVAEVLQEGTRTGADCAFRMGGEEMVCIVNAEPEKAIDIAERLREKVENTVHNIMHEGEPKEVKVTVSMGIHTMDPREQVTPENARRIFDEEFKNADNAVYEAKETGRNKVVASDRDMQMNYIADKAADVLCNTEINDKESIKETALEAFKSNDFEEVVQAVQDKSENPAMAEKAYKVIEMIDKFVPAIKQEMSKENRTEQSPVKSEKTEQAQEASEKKQPTYYNKNNYKNIDNKTYIRTDSKTAFNISKAAEKAGVEFSAKFDGKKSAVTVDGIKDKSFIETVKSMAAWADKIQVRAAHVKEQQNNKGERS